MFGSRAGFPKQLDDPLQRRADLPGHIGGIVALLAAAGLAGEHDPFAWAVDLDAMAAGIDWQWKTFPEFLDRLDRLPKGINYAGYLGHSALRTYVMGERAFEQAATEDDLRAMERELRDAIRAGAMGFTTSRSPSHETPDGRPVASRLATGTRCGGWSA